MSRAIIVYTRQARAELIGIVDSFREAAGPRIAAKWRAKLGRRVALLRTYPLIGTPVDEFGPGRRRLAEGPYVIFYEARTPARVVVTRILDGRRDLPAVMRETVPD